MAKRTEEPEGAATEGAPAPAELRILVVDNDPAHAQAMQESLEREGYRCTVATSGPEGSRRIAQEFFDIVITDLVMNEVDGMALLGRAREALPEGEVVMVTGHGTVPLAVEAMQQGAFSFLEKPITPNRLRAVVKQAAEKVGLRRRNVELHQRLDEQFGFEGIVYASAKMRKVIEQVKRIAPTDARVLITGENGTGKELVAQAIHQNSPRKAKRMVALNIAAVAQTLVESELFGHVRGAFTDALHDRVGAFEHANGGTLFFDEVGDMPAATQIKLLRVLEEHKITRVGDNKAVDINVRVLSATNRDLEEAIKRGEFRSDLYFRLKVVTIELPPLRDRREDIVPLVDHFRKHFVKKHHKTVKSITPAARQRLFAYEWPGNIRQLRNAVETMVVLDADDVLDVDDLPPELADLPAEEVAEANAAAGGSSELLGRSMADIEKWAILETLRLTNGNREEAARILKIGARTLYRKLSAYNEEAAAGGELGAERTSLSDSEAGEPDDDA